MAYFRLLGRVSNLGLCFHFSEIPVRYSYFFWYVSIVNHGSAHYQTAVRRLKSKPTACRVKSKKHSCDNVLVGLKLACSFN